jgi:hypothetical protein
MDPCLLPGESSQIPVGYELPYDVLRGASLER